ncbi:MAG: methyl-accepting chemotaxis protein, partial [bacterium]
MKLDIMRKLTLTIVLVTLLTLSASTFINYIQFKAAYKDIALSTGMPREVVDVNLQQIVRDSLWILLISFIVATGLLLYVAIVLVIKPLKQFTKAANKIAGQEGDLSQFLEVKTKDEIGALTEAFNGLIRNMYRMVKQLRETADLVSNSAQGLSASTQEMNASTEEISSTLQQISKGVTTQARRVEETSRAMEEMMTLVKQ